MTNAKFINKLDLVLRKKLVKCWILSMAFMLLKLEHFGKEIRNTRGVLQYVDGEGWRRSVGASA
jgi:hypothetical protein